VSHEGIAYAWAAKARYASSQSAWQTAACYWRAAASAFAAASAEVPAGGDLMAAQTRLRLREESEKATYAADECQRLHELEV
jgi:hypothetical protein